MKSIEERKNIVVCVSGSGRSLLNLLVLEKTSNYHISSVITSNENCKAIEHAKRYDKNIHTMKFLTKENSVDYGKMAKKLTRIMVEESVELIVLAGFLKLFPAELFSLGPKIINIHPALLPEFGGKGMFGMNVHEAVIKSGVKITGATVHFVNEKYDEGRLISQIKVMIKPSDSPQSLSERVFEAEKILLPETIKMILDGSLSENTAEIHQIVAKDQQ